MLRVFSGLLALTRVRRLWCARARDESTFEKLWMLRAPVQWGSPKISRSSTLIRTVINRLTSSLNDLDCSLTLLPCDWSAGLPWRGIQDGSNALLKEIEEGNKGEAILSLIGFAVLI
jgi:hypothetical protein